MFLRLQISVLLAGLFFALPAGLRAATVYVNVPTPGGIVSIPITINHAGLDQPVDTTPTGSSTFHPPAVFSAPLPTGSGARALGLAGAFTAVADDATAASWNPAGLTQLERPEVSVVYRFSSQEDKHDSKSRDLETDENRYNSSELNYASAVYPFLLNDRAAVFSVNYQEAYDFTQTFTAQFSGNDRTNIQSTVNQTFYDTQITNYSDATLSLTIETRTTTHTESQINQVLQSSLLTGTDFSQQGTIDAFSFAFAMDTSPRFSVGVVLNVYVDGAARGNPIQSSLIADYGGVTTNYADITNIRDTIPVSAWYGEVYTGSGYNRVTNDISGSSTGAPLSSVESSIQEGAYLVNGCYYENNRTEQFYGFNATLGALWVASDQLTLGATVDLPWTGRGEQIKTIQHTMTAVSTNGVEQSYYQNTQRRDVEYTFPLYWALGGLWRWNDRFYTSLDVSCTHWSQFSYKAEGEERINPLDGEPYSSSGIDDCWAVRCGSEYLCMLSWTEIPLRGGVFWEQRPAIGSPDEYWGFSLGSGISLGKEPGRMILDIAYTFERGENVMGSLLPGQNMSSDVTRHRVFVSAIWHF